MDPERRQFTRFLVPNDTFAALGPSFTKVGRIKDLSIGGLALEYLTDGESGLEHSQVDIFIKEGKFHLSKLPCKIVYDIRLEPSGAIQAPAGALVHKCCGVKLGRLSKNKKKRLEDFLKKHACGVA